MSSSFNLNGNVGIQTQPNSLYALDVNGDIHCNRVFAQNTSFTGPTGPQGTPGTTSGILYYLNKGVTGSATGYFQMAPNAVIGQQMYTGTVVLPTSGSTGVIAGFITDTNVPNVLFVPAGIWNATCFLSALAAGGGSPLTDAQCYIQLFQYSSTGSQTFIGQSSVQPVTTTSASPYQLAIQVNQTVLSSSDRLILKLIGKNSSSPTKSITITGYFQDSTYSNVITSLTLPVAQGPTGPIGPAGGESGQLLFNQSGSATGTNSLVYNSTTNVLSVPNMVSSGNVGISTGSPMYPLDVNGYAAVGDRFYTRPDSGGINGNSWIGFRNGVEPSNLAIGFQNTGSTSTVHSINFMTYGSNRMTVNSDGYVLIGYPSSNGSYKLQVNSQIFATNSTIATSDAKYKENIIELTGALNLIESLRPVSYNWKPHPVHSFSEGTTIGFIAQEVKEILKDTPYVDNIIKSNECTYTSSDGEIIIEDFLGIAEGHLIPLLTGSIQEQSSKIKRQQLTIQTLQIQVRGLQEQIDAII